MPELTAYVAFSSKVPGLIVHGLQEFINIRQVLSRFWLRAFFHWASNVMRPTSKKKRCPVGFPGSKGRGKETAIIRNIVT